MLRIGVMTRPSMLPIVAVMLILCASASAQRPFANPSLKRVDRAISRSAGYLERICSPEGEFIYEVDALSGKESDSYNIVRHAGAMYSLGMLRGVHNNSQVNAALARSATYLRKNYVGPGILPGQLAVWSKPLPLLSTAELGATGLGLVALIEARRASPRSVSLYDLQRLGRFLLFLQREDGSFIHQYRPDTGPRSDWQSLYYPGEAALGLISLYEVDHSHVWLAAAGKALSYLAESRAGSYEVPPDHWALIATAKFLPYCANGEYAPSRGKLLYHAVQITRALLKAQQNRTDDPALDGAFDPNGRIAPTATCIEGLLAALSFLPKDTELRATIEASAARGVEFLLQAQITSGPYAGGMPRAYIYSTPSKIPIRIDYVQHSLSAWIQYQ